MTSEQPPLFEEDPKEAYQRALREHERLTQRMHRTKGKRPVSPLWQLEEKQPAHQRRRSITDF